MGTREVKTSLTETDDNPLEAMIALARAPEVDIPKGNSIPIAQLTPEEFEAEMAERGYQTGSTDRDFVVKYITEEMQRAQVLMADLLRAVQPTHREYAGATTYVKVEFGGETLYVRNAEGQGTEAANTLMNNLVDVIDRNRKKEGFTYQPPTILTRRGT